MRIGFISLLLLTACAAKPTCEQQAYEAAGNAMANVQYNLNRQADRNAMVNCSSANGCPNVPLKDTYDTGESSGQYSNTAYRGPNARQAYDRVIARCGR
jgi:hypothetical protein